MLSHFHRIMERSGQTDGQTDRQNRYINIARLVLTRDKKISLQEFAVVVAINYSEENLDQLKVR